MNTAKFTTQLKKLTQMSEQQFLTPDALSWPSVLPKNQWCFKPELISIYGSEQWYEFTDAQKKKLSFYEAINFFSLNVHGEKYLINAVSSHLFNFPSLEMSEYLLHFIEEEAKHMMYFSRFCIQYANKIYPLRALEIGAPRDDEIELLLLFARIYIFETIVDEYNRQIAGDSKVVGIVSEINRLHHLEESRHLAFGLGFLKYWLTELHDRIDEHKLQQINQHLNGFLHNTWKQFYCPDAYFDAGLTDCASLSLTVFNSEPAKQHRDKLQHKRLAWFYHQQLLGDVA
ncbi:diiron oxygenase [Thalassotalea nanhaiensis]|uniref:Diiron oxygenase n=1 Tax=Thalassotalea nanhaiensis TaxID=3065648 RepID=A0ABY9TI76_9GAMM|nr:diiron oxygenase [Colwelliaceae bacterium SQ345]